MKDRIKIDKKLIITGKVPVEEVKVSDTSFTYKTESFDLKVMYLERRSLTKKRSRFAYIAYCIPPKEFLDLVAIPKHSFLKDMYMKDLVRVGINRKLNKHFNPKEYFND